MSLVVTFGEVMLKLSPTSFERLLQARQLNVEYSGAEANVAVSLSIFGIPTSFVSVVPSNDIGNAAVNFIRHYGVDTSKIVRRGERLGVYFAEKGASQRSSKVVYDRAHSAISCALESDFDWDVIFADAKWFHFTGITPALSDSLAAICLAACKAAKSKGMTVSCDLNYRSKLWSKEKAGRIMSQLCEYVDVCIANEADARDFFGILAPKTDVEKGIIDQSSYAVVAKQMADKFGFHTVCITLRESVSASDNNWSAILHEGKATYFSKKYPIHIVDRIGGGDSFAAGLIYSQLNKFDSQHAIDFAVAASCLKHTIEGDFNLVTVEEVEDLVNSDGTGRIQR
ncbi:MAG: sugar kinase [Bacteroidales bacterium]|nr:sugar kinase [Bacteroidales bacterium]